MKGLSRIVRKESFSTSRIDKVIYSFDASQIEGKTAAVVVPSNAEQIRKIITYAKRIGANVVPRGAGTGLAGGAVPKESIVIDLSRMNKIIKLELKRRVVVVEPGAVLENLNNFLKKHGLFFPIIPSSAKVCTIGGMLATNAAGNYSVRYGRTNEWVEELEIIDGTGKQFTLRGKEAAEFCGTEGTAGIITQATLKLLTPPQKRSFTLYKFKTMQELIEKLKELKQLNTTEVEFFDKLTTTLIGIEPAYYLFVEFDDDTGELTDSKRIDELNELRDSAYPVLASHGYHFIEDPKIDIDKMDELVSWLETNGVPSFGHIGVGIIHPCFRNKDLIPEFYEIVKKLNGSIGSEHGIGLKKQQYIEKGFLEKIKKLKKAYDPNNVLNKGKIV